jgi:type IV secretion system protein VirD4
MVLLLLECGEKEQIHFKSLRYLRNQILGVSEKRHEFQTNFLDHIDQSSFIFSCLNGTFSNADDTARSIISVFDQSLKLFFTQENLITMLSRSDFNFKDLGNQKTALFLIMPDEKTTYHRLVSLFIKQCYEMLIFEAQKQESKRLPVRINFLLDEFASLPRITDFPSMITASRSRNIRFNLFIQSFLQLSSKYDIEAETIRGNCNNLIFLTSKEKATLKEIELLAGNRNNGEPLISISALQRLNKEKGEAFILHDRLYPFIAKLKDIDSYDETETIEQTIYPINTTKIEAVLDIKKFYKKHSRKYLAQLFTGKKPIEDRQLDDDPNGDSTSSNNLVIDPIFFSKERG